MKPLVEIFDYIQEAEMGLTGPSKTIVVESVEAPSRPQEPAPEREPVRTPDREKVPA